MNYTKLILPLILIFFCFGCGNSEKQQQLDLKEKQEKASKDSLDFVNKLKEQKEKKIQDSLIQIEQNIAIGEINFGISKKEFDQAKELFLKKCKLPEMEFYKGLTIFTYKIGEYGFSALYGSFHNESLYSIRFRGPIVDYDEYNRVMPDQYSALMNILKQKYGEPSINNGLPEWTDLEKGYFKRAAIWDIGTKRIEVQISCEGVRYYLNMEVFKPEIEQQIRNEKEEKENQSTKNALDIL